jgi:hypothetical protein
VTVRERLAVMISPSTSRGSFTSVEPGWDPQRAGSQVGRAARHDGQRHPGAGQRVRAGPDGAVATGRDDQAGSGSERVPGQAQAVITGAGLGEDWFPARRTGR